MRAECSPKCGSSRRQLAEMRHLIIRDQWSLGRTWQNGSRRVAHALSQASLEGLTMLRTPACWSRSRRPRQPAFKQTPDHPDHGKMNRKKQFR